MQRVAWGGRRAPIASGAFAGAPLSAERVQGENAERMRECSANDSECRVNEERVRSECRASAERVRNEYRANAARVQSECSGNMEWLQSEFIANAAQV